MPTRVFALIAAVVMVVGALSLRTRLDQRKEDKAHRPQLVCVTELADFCKDLSLRNDVDVVVEPAGQTADRLVALNGDQGIDGWLTTAPWPAIAEQQRQAKSLPALFRSATPPVVARSPLVMAVWPDRAQAVAANCPNAVVGWKCAGEVAGKKLWSGVKGGQQAWGPVKVAFGDPANSAVGLLVLAHATSDYFGRTDLSRADLENDGYIDWLSGLHAAVPLRLPAFSEVLVAGPAVEDIYGATEADVAPALAAAARPIKPNLLYPSPVMTADLVLATVPGRVGDRVRDALDGAVKDMLPKYGWRVPGASVERKGTSTTAATIPLPAGNNLPDAGLLDALRAAWKAA